jgi:hypothetical protein
MQKLKTHAKEMEEDTKKNRIEKKNKKRVFVFSPLFL